MGPIRRPPQCEGIRSRIPRPHPEKLREPDALLLSLISRKGELPSLTAFSCLP
jgi:hypothetical protein